MNSSIKEQIQEKENMIYSLNQKIERVLLNNDHFKQETPISDVNKTSKMTILSQINTVIIDICMDKMTDKFNEFSDFFNKKIENLENQLNSLQFSSLSHEKTSLSNSFDTKLDKFNRKSLYSQLNTSILSKVQAFNDDFQSKFNEKISNSIKIQLENLKKEIEFHHISSNKLTANINTNNMNTINRPRHEKKPSAGNIFSDIFSWKKTNSFSLNNLMNNDENKPKFNEVFGTNYEEIAKVTDFFL